MSDLADDLRAFAKEWRMSVHRTDVVYGLGSVRGEFTLTVDQIEAAALALSQPLEYNVARQSEDGVLWDLEDDLWVATKVEAEIDVRDWSEGLDLGEGDDPIVIVQRRRGAPPGMLEVVQ